MKKYLKEILITLSLLSSPVITLAAPTSWDFASGILQPLTSQRTAEVRADHYVATSTATSTLPALESNISDSLIICIAGDCKSAWPSATATWGSITGTLSSQTDLQNALNAKQDTLVSGTNIKTINGSSVLGSGDLVISGSGGSGNVATSTGETAGNLAYWTSTNGTPALLGKVATSSLTTSGLLNLSQPIFGIGSANSVLTLPVTKGYFVVGNDAGQAQATSSIFVSSVGNVGIGTTGPLAKLQVAGSAGNEFLAGQWAGISDTDGGEAVFGMNAYGANSGTFRYSNTHASIGASGIVIPGYGDGAIKFFINTGASTQDASFTPSYKMVIKNDGNVGIGTTGPSYKLDVTGGAIRTTSYLQSDNTGGNEVILNSNGANFGMISNQGTGIWSLGYGTTQSVLGTSVLAWNSSGNVGIGTTTPSDKLTIDGNGRFENQGQLKLSELRINGNQSATLSASSSMVADVNWTLPKADGTAGQVLMTNGVGNLDWITKGNGTVTSVGTNNGLTGGTITDSGTIGLNTTGLSTNGLITWNGSNLVATGTPQLTVGNVLATSTTPSLFINASTTNISSSYSSSTNYVAGDVTVPHLGTAAGAFLASDPTGKIIATSTPSGGTSAFVGMGYASTTSTGYWQVPVTLTAGQKIYIQANNGNSASGAQPQYHLYIKPPGIATTTLDVQILGDGNGRNQNISFLGYWPAGSTGEYYISMDALNSGSQQANIMWTITN